MSQDNVGPVVAFVFARGGSKGLPGKNVRLLAGKPLIAHAVDTARACARVETVIVSTDDDAIADAARASGAEVPFVRPAELATDSAPEWLAWRHAITWWITNRGPLGTFLSLPATAPLRSVADVDACLDTLQGDSSLDVVLTGMPASRSPWFNMVKRVADGRVDLVLRDAAVSRRQDAPAVFDLTTVAYAARPQFLLRADRIFDGNVGLVEVPPERAIDIDTLLDFEFAEFLVARKNRKTEA